MEDRIIGLFGGGNFIRFTPISKEAVLSGDLSAVDSIVQMTSAELKAGIGLIPWNMTISGYDTDPRSLPMIPEVVEWFKKVHAKYPFFGMILSEFSVHSFLLSQINLQVMGSGKSPDLSEAEEQRIDRVMDFIEEVDPANAEDYRPQFQDDVVYGIDIAEVEQVVGTISITGMLFMADLGVPAEDQTLIMDTAIARIYSVLR